MTRHRGLLLAALGVAILQIGFLSWIIASRAAVLRTGREITLKAEPIDPRDLLRGDYVNIGYAISTLSNEILQKDQGIGNHPAGSTIVVRVKPGAGGFYEPVSARFDVPPSPQPAPDEVDMKGTIRSAWAPADASIAVDYGIERYYVPEGEGVPLVDRLRAGQLSVRVALSGGAAQIKALFDGATMLYEEPLY